MRKRCIALLSAVAVVAIGMPAWADYKWNFTEDLEGWQDNHTESWGALSMLATWEARTGDDGMMVLTYDPVTEDSTEFRPRVYMFYWNSSDWNASYPDVNGGQTGRYAVVRYRVADATDVAARLAVSFERNYGGGTVVSSHTKEEIEIGSWVTSVIDLTTDNPDPIERIFMQIGNKDVGPGNDRLFFENGGRIEVDFIHFVDDPTPYLTWTFDDGTLESWRVGPTPLWEVMTGFLAPTAAGGILDLPYTDDPEDLYAESIFVPTIVNEHMHLRPAATSDLYVNMRLRVNADPGVDQARLELLWREGGNAEWSGPGFDLSDSVEVFVPTNEWVRASFPVSEAVGYGQDVGSLYSGAANQWVMGVGSDRANGFPLIPELVNAEFDYITVGPYPVGQDSDSDGLRDYEEAAFHGTDPNNADTSGNGIPDGWLVERGLDPLDPGIADQDLDGDGYTLYEEYVAGTDPFDVNSNPGGPPAPPVPAAGAAGLAALGLALMAAARRRMGG